jgi:hypothetical protein
MKVLLDTITFGTERWFRVRTTNVADLQALLEQAERGPVEVVLSRVARGGGRGAPSSAVPVLEAAARRARR